MKILVTGGTGFIGSNLCLKLLANGDTVYAVDNFITSDASNIAELQHNPNFYFNRLDITSAEFIKLFSATDLDIIYHLACPTGVPNLGPLAEEMLLTCSIGTKNVLDIALKQHAKILLTSSSEVYGDPLVFPQDEEYTGNVNPIGHRSPYEEGKRFSESLVTAYHHKFGLNTKIVRIFNTYGPYMSFNDTRVIPKFLVEIFNNRNLTIKKPGNQTRTFCFVKDLVNGLILVMEKGESGTVYNLGGEEELSIIDLANLMLEITNSSSQIKLVEGDYHDHKRRKPALKKIKSLGWSPETTLEEGLLKTISHYQL